MTLGFVLAAALLGGCLVVVLLVVRLLVLDHADEIAIMRLIGARERDIRLPYVVLGLVLGTTGSLLGVLALLGLDLALKASFPALALGTELLIVLPLGARQPVPAVPPSGCSPSRRNPDSETGLKAQGSGLRLRLRPQGSARLKAQASLRLNWTCLGMDGRWI